MEDFIAKEDSKSKSESSSSRKSSLGSPISSDIEVNETEAGEGDEVSFDDEPEIIEDEIQEIQISSEEKVSDFCKKIGISGSTYPLKFKMKYSTIQRQIVI